MQVPENAFAPWCVGSIFPAPQLITGAAAASLGPLLFDRDGEPERLLFTGCPMQYAFHEAIEKPSLQVDDFLASCTDNFFPREILLNSLKEDASLKISVATNSNQLLGNRLQSIKWREGAFQLFFPIGKNLDKIGSVICCSREGKGLSSSILNTRYKISGGGQYSDTFSMCQPIRQIAAFQGEPIGNANYTSVAVRTLYQVHWLTSQIEDENIVFDLTAAANFQQCASHVAWNPYVPGEAAVVLGNGEVQLFDLKSKMAESTSFAASNHDDRKILPKFADNLFKAKQKRLGKKYQRPGFVEVDFSAFENNWWCCEYAWHPRTLLVAGSKEVSLVDFRHKPGDKQVQGSPYTSTLAKMSRVGGLASYCNQVPEGDCFGAFTRADCDGMYQFATASKQHLQLFDVRRPLTPVLQWEHRMLQDSPGFLLMCPLSTLRPLTRGLSSRSTDAGRVILAASFRSGDIHAFCYGPKPQFEPLAQESAAGGWESGLNDIVYSWELPSKLTIGRVCSDERDFVSECNRGNTAKKQEQVPLPRKQGNLEIIAGMCVLPNEVSLASHSKQQIDQNIPVFTILQLTGLGAIMSQKYKASRKLANLEFQLSGLSSKLVPPIDIIGKKRVKKSYWFEYLPAFLNYVQNGSVWPVYFAQGKGFNERTGKFSVFSDCHPDKFSEVACEQFTPCRQAALEDDKSSLVGQSMADAQGLSKSLIDIKEKSEADKKLEDCAVSLIKEINAPLSLYEMSTKVFWRSMPGDFAAISILRQKGPRVGCRKQYTGLDLPQLLPSNDICALLVDANDLCANAKLRWSNSSETILVGPAIPLPLMLDIQQFHTGKSSNEEFNAPFLHEKGNGFPKLGKDNDQKFVSTNLNAKGPTSHPLSGHKRLMDGCRKITLAIEKLQFQKLAPQPNDFAVSLSDSMDLWSNNPDGQECSVSPDFLFHSPTMGLSYTQIPGRLSTGDMHDQQHDKGLIGSTKMLTMVSDSLPNPVIEPGHANSLEQENFFKKKEFSKFVASSCESSHMMEEDAFPKILAELCPIDLDFRDSGINLQTEEMASLSSLRDQFKDWQGTFQPYLSYCERNIDKGC